MTELEALQNAANDLDLMIYEKIPDGRRKVAAKKYFTTRKGLLSSPVLDYDQMNHFLLGWRKCFQLYSPKKK